MRYLLIATCCAVLFSSAPVAAAAVTAPAGHQTVKAHDPMNANAKMKKKHTKKAKSDDGMKKDTK